MPVIVSIVGRSESGKTTLIEKLIPELESRGYRVATIKHAPQGMRLDDSDKDSWRHIEAGSRATVISSPGKVVLIKPVSEGTALKDLSRLLGEGYDIILTEGFKSDSAPKIEVHRKDIGPPLEDLSKLVAIATDEPLDTQARQFSLDDIKGLTNLVEGNLLRREGDRVSLYVNGSHISLSPFPREFVANILSAMASSLKGVGEVEEVEIFLRKRK
jgi:molybdopterin-guanine dinucleotide biosynthesis protein B